MNGTGALRSVKTKNELKACTQDEKRAALENALGSRTFARSEQLRSFLRYVCEAELNGTGTAVTEYVIGTKVLHRPLNYSPAEDSTVRTRAYELRQKLESLYASELKEEPVVIAIPKGAYTPQFHRVNLALETPTLGEPETIQLSTPGPAALPEAVRRSGPLWTIVLTSAICGAVIATILFGSIVKRSEPSPIVAEAWGAFAQRDEATLLVPAVPLYLVLGPETHGAYRTSIYPAPAEAYPLFREHRPLAPGAKLGMIFTNDALGIGNLEAIEIASAVVKELGTKTQIFPERSAMMPVLHGRDAVLFGAPVDSQLISEVLENAPLTVAYDDASREFAIRDQVTRQVLNPETKPDGDFRSVYGLVSVLNDRESARGHLGMIVFSGITSVGTHGAAEYFSSPRALQELKATFRRQGLKGFPNSYQVVVKCRFENMQLVSEEYQSHRIWRQAVRAR